MQKKNSMILPVTCTLLTHAIQLHVVWRSWQLYPHFPCLTEGRATPGANVVLLTLLALYHSA